MKKWKIKDRPNTSHLEKQLGISSILATILYQRNIKEVEEAKQFLSPQISHLHSPFLFPDMEKARRNVPSKAKAIPMEQINRYFHVASSERRCL